MKTCKKIFCTLLVFCLAVVMFPKITLADGGPDSESIIFYQPVGETKFEGEPTLDLYTSKSHSVCCLIYERFLQQDFYRVKLSPGINNEDVKSIILLGEITDKYGTFPVKMEEGLGDTQVDRTYSEKYGHSIPSGITNHFPNLTTLYLPKDLIDDMGFMFSFRFNSTIKDIYYDGTEEYWKDFITKVANLHLEVHEVTATGDHIFKWDTPSPFATATSHFNAYPELDVTYKDRIITVKIKDTTATTTTN